MKAHAPKVRARNTQRNAAKERNPPNFALTSRQSRTISIYEENV
jgi:hypothetical protein